MAAIAASDVLYATLACPYAHRAMLALALRPVPGINVNSTVPTKNQLVYLENVGTEPLGVFTRQDPLAQLQARKDWYVREIIANGETPTLQLRSGEILSESEIVSEYIDAVSSAPTPKLVPADPLVASRVRRSMKQFNAVPPAMVKLLKNQLPEQDAPLMASLDSTLAAFASTLEGADAQFCHGESCSLADVHAGPFLFRFTPVLSHYRGYDLLGRHPRLERVVAALQSLPAWNAVLQPVAVTSGKLVAFYAQYANDMLWGDSVDGGRVLIGRGAAAAAL